MIHRSSRYLLSRSHRQKGRKNLLVSPIVPWSAGLGAIVLAFFLASALLGADELNGHAMFSRTTITYYEFEDGLTYLKRGTWNVPEQGFAGAAFGALVVGLIGVVWAKRFQSRWSPIAVIGLGLNIVLSIIAIGLRMAESSLGTSLPRNQ